MKKREFEIDEDVKAVLLFEPNTVDKIIMDVLVYYSNQLGYVIQIVKDYNDASSVDIHNVVLISRYYSCYLLHEIDNVIKTINSSDDLDEILEMFK